MEVKDKIIEEIKKIYDPELPVNIYELGLIYDIQVNDKKAKIKMTLTTPNCPVAESLPKEVKESVMQVEEIENVDLENNKILVAKERLNYLIEALNIKKYKLIDEFIGEKLNGYEPKVMGIETRLEQVLANLLDNAVSFSPNNSLSTFDDNSSLYPDYHYWLNNMVSI